MNNADAAFAWEEIVRAALRVRDADPEFARRLREELVRKSAAGRAAQRRPALRPAWILVSIVFTALLGAFLLIGPEKVVAALQSLFGYIPGAGFVQMDRPFRILAEPVEEKKSGAALYVRQMLADDRRTVVVYEVDCPGPETQWLKTGTHCTEAPALLLPGGARLEADVRLGRSAMPFYRERAEFPALPPEVNGITLSLPFRAKPGEALSPWIVDIALSATSQESTIYPVMEIAPSVLPQTGGTASDPLPAGINLTLERIVAMEEQYLLQGSLEWDPGRYASAEMDYRWLEIVDGEGSLCPWEFADPDSPAAESENRTPWAVAFNPRGRPGPFQIRAGSILAEMPANASFEMDFGSAPSLGQTWALDIPLRAAEHDLRVTSATLDGGNGSISVIFSFAGNGNVFGATWIDEGQTVHPLEGGGPERLRIFESGAAYGRMPFGSHTIRLTSLRLQLQGEWILPIDLNF